VSQDNKHKDATLYCTLCQRRIGLWAYVRASPTSPNGNGRADPLSPFGSPLPPRNLPQPKVLDVLKEHRSFCPYIVKSTPLPSIGGKPREAIVEGWRAVLSVVGRCGMSSRRRRSDLFGGILGLDQSKGEELGMDVDNLVDGVKRGGVSILLDTFNFNITNFNFRAKSYSVTLKDYWVECMDSLRVLSLSYRCVFASNVLLVFNLTPNLVSSLACNLLCDKAIDMRNF
jgi:hypothetical protein